jgi:hypothetical protein
MRGYNQQADQIDKMFKKFMLAGYSLNERLVYIPSKKFNDLFSDVKFISELSVYIDSKYHLQNHCFKYNDVHGYVSSCSVNSFNDFLYEKSLLVNSKPLGHTEEFLIFTNLHAMKFTIKKKNYGLKFKFYDPNYSCTTKNIIAAGIDEVKKIQLTDILYKASDLTQYNFLMDNNNDLHTMQFIQIPPEIVSMHQPTFN